MVTIRTFPLILLSLSLAGTAAAQGLKASPEKERELIAVLQGQDKPAKALACKQLAVIGGEASVPALAALLSDKELNSWARIALEAIPGPAADQALRDAVSKVEGRQLVGVINSIGVRRDAKAVETLAQKLKSDDESVVIAAAAALGHIGGEQAERALSPLLVASAAPLRQAAAEGAVLCAEGYLNRGEFDRATKLYDAVRNADVNGPRKLEATRGAVLARQTAGIPLLIELINSPDDAMFGVALSVSREMKGTQVTDSLINELRKANPDRQISLVAALADRSDTQQVLPALLRSATSGTREVRMAALSLLERFSDLASIPVLLEAAAAEDADLAKVAMGALSRVGGQEVDRELVTRLSQSSGKTRQVLIELAGNRRIEGAMPLIVRFSQDADAGVRSAALDTLGAIGEESQAAALVKLLESAPADGRGDIEKALMGIAGRCGATCVPHLMPMIKSDQSGMRIIALHTLATAGGPESLAAVRAAVEDKDEAVADEAVRTLGTWANRWPDDASITDPLLALAKSGKKPSHQVLALRGYLQYIQSSRKLAPDRKLALLKDATPLLSRPEEKRQAISVLSAIATGGALEPLATLAADESVSDEACSAILGLMTRRAAGASNEQRRKALQVVIERSKDDGVKRRAQELLRGIPAGAQ